MLLGVGLLTQHNADYSYESKLIWIVGTAVAMAAAAFVLRKLQQRLRARGFNIARYAICGVNELGIQLARISKRAPEMGLRMAGFYDDRPDGPHRRRCRRKLGRHVGNIEELVHRARRGDYRYGLHHVPDAGRGPNSQRAREARRYDG